MNEYNGYSKTEILESILLSDNVVNSINENMDLFLKILPEIENLISFDKHIKDKAFGKILYVH